jgi:hypothetical protein
LVGSALLPRDGRLAESSYTQATRFATLRSATPFQQIFHRP